MILVAGALLGLIAVAFGAYAEHALQGVDPGVLDSVRTAARYNQMHAVLVVAIGLIRLRSGAPPGGRLLAWAAWLFVAGTVLFSFSIYVSAATGTPALTAATPFGGVSLMAGWVVLAWCGMRFTRA